MRVALYARVSTRDKEQDPETQLYALRAYAAQQGWQIVQEYVDQFMANPGSGVAFGWQDQTFQFTATTVTQNLSFQAVPPNFGDLIGLGLDGVSISAVPIPAAAWLFGSALGLLGWMRRKAV